MDDAMVLVRDYLVRLDDAARPLPVARRAELAKEVHDHIDSALAEAGRQDEVTIRNVLERLGRPEEIVAAEAGMEGPHAAWAAPFSDPSMAKPCWGATEIIALLLLALGWALLPVIGPLVGLIFAWGSTLWTTRQKVIATVIVVFLAVVPLLGLLAAGAGGGALASSNVLVGR